MKHKVCYTIFMKTLKSTLSPSMHSLFMSYLQLPNLKTGEITSYAVALAQLDATRQVNDSLHTLLTHLQSSGMSSDMESQTSSISAKMVASSKSGNMSKDVDTTFEEQSECQSLTQAKYRDHEWYAGQCSTCYVNGTSEF